MVIDRAALEQAISRRGRDFFAAVSGEAPTVFNKSWWSGKVLEYAMDNDDFRTRLFRFIDVLPALTDDETAAGHLMEYFSGPGQDLPAVLKWGAQAMGQGTGLAGRMFARLLRSNIEAMAHLFIIGRNLKQALPVLRTLRKDGFAATVDILGEATVSIAEERSYQQSYLDLLAALAADALHWRDLGGEGQGGQLDWGHAPRVNIAVKPTTLYCQANPRDFAGTVAALVERFTPIVTRAREVGAFVCIDMEQHRFKDITIELFRKLRASPQFRDYPHLGLALQSYLRETDQDLDQLIGWARSEGLPISIRLVKGAYWDYETLVAGQNGWPPAVYTEKAETDAAFERQAGKVLANHDICHLACGSHNVRSIAAVMETALALQVPSERYEFQVLYGMAEPVRKGLLKAAGRVRLYCPFGELLPGMAYLVRRLLENTANESFLRQSFAEGAAVDALLQNPATKAGSSRLRQQPAPEKAAGTARGYFQNEPAADFTRPEVRTAFPDAIRAVRGRLGATWPLKIGGREVVTDDLLASANPADPDETIGLVCQAGPAEIEAAIAAAGRALPAWQETSATERAGYLFAAAGLIRRQIFTQAAWQVLECGKQWDQAHADVTEAIDFLEYYGREMLRLGEPQRLGQAPGEVNHYFYQPRGVAAVIAPWNFPLAISCGMCAAALVTGNCVLFKPSGLASVVGAQLAAIFHKVGLPAGVFNFVPGRSSRMGDFLVDHPLVDLIAFTGSREVGLRIAERAARVHPDQVNVKKVIAEMGGKNAIIVDDDADLDEAMVHVLQSAFGYQGQKCSACSRVIVLSRVYDRFVRRLVEAASSIKIGPAEDPASFMGPVIDGAAQCKVLDYIEIGRQEGKLLLLREVPDKGFYAPLAIFGGIAPRHRLAREEIFGPVLSVMRAGSFTEAIALANDSAFALTGGVFSRSPRHLQQARQYFRVGNLYLNRGVTGALVGRQPFGGFKMSGIGSKPGGPDYLLQFMEPRVVTENTMRRGFAPREHEP